MLLSSILSFHLLAFLVRQPNVDEFSQLLFFREFLFLLLLLFFFPNLLVRAAPMAYGSSQARGRIGTAAYTTATAMWDLSRSSWQCWILNPVSGASDQTYILMDTSQISFCCATLGTPLRCSFDLNFPNN